MAGDLLTLSDGKNQVTRWTYDAFGRARNKTNHLGAEMFAYTYDADDRLTSCTTPAKGTTTYSYDKVGNLTNIDYAVSPDISLAYDKLNRLTNMVDTVGTTGYAYANLDLLNEDGPWASDTVTYTNVNRLRTGMGVQAPSGPAWKQTYAYDAMRRLTNVTSGSGSFGYKYGVQASSLPIRVALPGGSYTTNTYDGNARLLKTQLKNSGNTLLNSHSYGYNAGNQRTTVTNFYTNRWDYSYDDIGQLKTAKGTEASGGTNRWHEQFGYVYDAAGNLQTRTNNALLQNFVVNSLNQLSNATRSGTLTVSGATLGNPTSVTVNSSNSLLYLDGMFASTNHTPADGLNTFTAVATKGTSTNTNSISAWLPVTQPFSYDANGNLLSDGRQALAYDDENQLISVLVTNTWKSEFTYDGRMRLRVRKEYTWSGSWVLSSETRYVYDGMLVIQERNGSNTPQITYTRGRDLSGTMEGAGGIGGLLALTDHSQTAASVATAYYHCDGNGNVTALINTNGVIVARYAYDAYGNMLSITGPRADVNRHRFSSKELHRRSGLYSYGRRFYAPEWQRWPNRDPLDEEGGINLYTFVFNDPSDSVDPIGLAAAGERCDCSPCEIKEFKIEELRNEAKAARGLLSAKATYNAKGVCANIEIKWWSCTGQGNWNALNKYPRYAGWAPEHWYGPYPDNIYTQGVNRPGVAQITKARMTYLSCEGNVWINKGPVQSNTILLFQ